MNYKIVVLGSLIFLTIGKLGLAQNVIADSSYAKKLFEEGKTLIDEKKYEAAREKLDSSKQIYLNTLGEKNIEYGNVLHSIALSFQNQNKLDTAIVIYQKSIKVKEEALGGSHQSIAQSLNNLGNTIKAQRKFDIALEYHSKALEMRLKELGAEHHDVASSYFNLGGIFDDLKEFDKAIDYYNKALRIREAKLGYFNAETAWVYYNMGITYDKMSRFDEAIEAYLKSIEIRSKINPPIHIDLANSYNNLAISYYNNNEFYKSIDYNKKTLFIRTELFGNENLDVAWSYNNLGNSYRRVSEYKEAISCHKQAIAIRSKLTNPYHSSVGVSFINLGNIYASLDNYTSAIECYAIAKDCFIKSFGETHNYIPILYYNIGTLYRQDAKYSKSIEYLNKALSLYINTEGEKSLQVADTYNSIGTSLLANNENEKAVEYIIKCNNLYKELNNSKPSNLRSYYNNMAVYYALIKNYSKSLEFQDSSLQVDVSIYGEDHFNTVDNYKNKGSIYEKLHDYTSALYFYQKELKIKQKHLEEKENRIAESYLNIARIYKLMQEYHISDSFYIRALNSYQYFDKKFQNKVSNGLINTLYSRASMLESWFINFNQIEKLRLSNEILDTVIHAWKLNFNDYSGDDAFVYLQEVVSKLHEIITTKNNFFLLQHTKEKKFQEELFGLSEYPKSLILRTAINQASALHFAEIPPDLLKEEQTIRLDLTYREKQRQNKLNNSISETDTAVLRISSIIFDLRQDYEALKQRLETDYPDYYRLKYDLSTVSLSYVQDSMLQDNQVMLEYFVGDSSLFLFLIRQDTFIVESIACDSLENWIEQFRQGLYGYHSLKEKPDALFEQTLLQYLNYAPKLYEVLIKPVEQWLPQNGKVILVPDGPLGYIPFDALITGPPADPLNFQTYPYLLNKYQFSYTYSATLLREMRDKKHRKSPAADFVAYAPFYDGNSTLLADMFSYDELMRKDLTPLPFSGREVAAASKLMKGQIVSGPKATKARFIQDAGNYRILHLATHGRADNRVGDYAFLVFSEIKDSIDNELLYVKDLYNISLNADLVVLSACETGIGKLQRGEGIISLARAFAYAGAKSMVTSLWSVNDASTSNLMRYFYRDLRKGHGKDEALRNARIDYLKREKTSERCHPFYWAAFVPVGDMRPVMQK